MGAEGFFRGLGQGIAEFGRQGIVEQSQARTMQLQADVQAKRDARMAQYQQAQITDERKHQAEAGARASEAQRAAMIEQRKYDEGVAETEATRDQAAEQANIQLRAKLDPRANKVTVNNGPAEYDPRARKAAEALGTADASRIESVNTIVAGAAQMEDTISIMEDISEQFETGKASEAAARLGQFLGTDAGAALQAWEGSQSQIVLQGAAALTGPASDTDMAIIERTAPSFGNDPRANKVLIDAMRRVMQRAVDEQKSMEAHIEGPGRGTLRGYSSPGLVGVNRAAEDEGRMTPTDDPLGLFQ